MKIKRILLSLAVLGALCVSAYGQNNNRRKIQRLPCSWLISRLPEPRHAPPNGSRRRRAERFMLSTPKKALYRRRPSTGRTNSPAVTWRCTTRSRVPPSKVRRRVWKKYDVVYIGYPIWWGVAPTIVNTFIEGHDLRGKRLIPFATSGGSGIEKSERSPCVRLTPA